MNDQTAQSQVEPQTPQTSQVLEDQNIFTLLGATDGTEQEREAFLDELQQVIWEDFLENDLQLLVTTDEYNTLQPLLSKSENPENDLAKQEELVGKLENLIPDLEEIMLEKALELKADLLKERIVSMREFYAGNEAALRSISDAEASLQLGKWFDAAQILNQIMLY